MSFTLCFEHIKIIVKIFLRVFLSLTFRGLQQEDRMNDKHKVCPTNHHATLNEIYPNLNFAKFKLGGVPYIKTSFAMLLLIVPTFETCSIC